MPGAGDGARRHSPVSPAETSDGVGAAIANGITLSNRGRPLRRHPLGAVRVGFGRLPRAAPCEDGAGWAAALRHTCAGIPPGSGQALALGQAVDSYVVAASASGPGSTTVSVIAASIDG